MKSPSLIDRSVRVYEQDNAALPYRGAFGVARPGEVDRLMLPPAAMPSHLGFRPLKAWRYLGVFGPDLMLCVGAVRVGPARQAFWAVWDRQARRLWERTVTGRGPVRLGPGRARVLDRRVQIDLALEETAGIESVCADGAGYGWTRKQGGVRARGTVAIDGEPRLLEARAVIDDTAAYYARHTSWRWSAGVGHARDGRSLAWNLVSGVNDPAVGSERTVWIDDAPSEAPPCEFESDLSGVDGLRFDAEAERARRENLLVLRSRYRQPFGTFSGRLPGGAELAEGWGVMEEHEAWW